MAPPATDLAGLFTGATRRWFESNFEAPTAVQRAGWPHIAAGDHTLMIAPTGSGKTLAAFLWCLDRLARERPAGPGVRVLYVSPLKALVYDIERNLRAPLAGMRRAAEQGEDLVHVPRVAVRTGDTPAAERRAQARDPAEILVTTPESLYLILGSRQRDTLASVELVIVDEIHALAPTKRGAHLALSLERLAAGCARDPQRIGLSATARPAEAVAAFLGGGRPVETVDSSTTPDLDLRIDLPGERSFRSLGAFPGDLGTQDADDPPGRRLEDVVLEEVRRHRSTIVFVNSRGLCERLTNQINELADGDELLVRAHHGSLAHGQRREIEEALKAGTLRGIVATSSLELGIDMGAVDLVLMVESPGAIARGLQRAGRAGHAVGETSVARILPRHPGDLLEATVVARGMRRGSIEPLRVPRNPLDVLAQQIVAMCSVRDWRLDELAGVVRRAAPFRELSDEALSSVLDMLSGHYPSADFAELRPRIVWDRDAGRLVARPGAGRVALISGGTIPDRGQYAVHQGEDGPRIGELDEEMVHETRVGQTITLGASTWRVIRITRDRVLVQPAPGEAGQLPFWRGDGPGRPVELGRELGAFTRELDARPPDDARAWLEAELGLEPGAARALVEYVRAQREAAGSVPTDRALTVERFRDELGDWRICILSPFGARIHAPWALAIEARLERELGFEVQALWSDDGVVVRFADAEAPPGLEALLPDPDEVEDTVVEQLGHSALFASHFRENAARALLLPRRRPGARTPLWVQRLRAQNLQAVARRFPSFPIVLETYRECLQDVFDVPGLREILRAVHEQRLRIDEVETPSASPFARALVFAYTAEYLYQGDMPLAERRAHALSLDRNLLRDLLGQDELRELLDPAVIAEVGEELQALAPGHRAAGAERLYDLLRSLGDLDDAEIAARSEGDPLPWVAELERARRTGRVKIGGDVRWIAVEDAALYRDALGTVPPPGVPDALLGPVDDAPAQLAARFARRRTPFSSADLAARYGLATGVAESALRELAGRDAVLRGDFLPGGRDPEWCDPAVLRRIRRRTLARLRAQVAPVESAALTRFLAQLHRVGAGAPGREAELREAVARLEGAPLSFVELERAILPARLPAYEPRMLDALGATGEIVWLGRGALGARDGRIALYRRERVGLLAEPPAVPPDLSPLAQRLLEQLASRGASFTGELAHAAGGPPQPALTDALRELVWAGLVTNDTFGPLRALALGPRPRRPGRGADAAAAGRWSLVSSLLEPPPADTERLHARALMLLDRYGVVGRAAAHAEGLPGGFAGLYDVYREMEQGGQLRRGHFVEGLEGAQFGYSGVVDALRAARPDTEERQVAVLAATDPASPYGALLPWPASPGGAAPRRAAGALVILVDGAPVLWLDRGGRRALSFEDATGGLEHAIRGLRELLFRDRRRGPLRLREIDGAPARQSRVAALLLGAGFAADGDGLVLERFA